MNRFFSLTLAFSFLVTISFSQALTPLWSSDTTLKVPESVLLDVKNQRLYVSNIDGTGPWDKDGKGSISLLTLSGKILNPSWVKGLNAPKGMALYKDFLLVADIDSVVIIDYIKAQILKKVYVEGATGLNDITTDKSGNMYVSDSRNKKIFYIDASKLEVANYLIEGLESPNGVLYVDKTLFIVDAGKFYKVDKDKNKTLISEGFDGGSDGIEQVDEHTFLISCWVGTIWLAKLNGEKKMILDTRIDKINAADIGYDSKNKIVYVPTFWKNNVMAYQLK
jgi:DNA-binding beta-propeller fold protein YncE